MIDLNNIAEATEAENAEPMAPVTAPEWITKKRVALAAIGIVLGVAIAWPSETPAEKLAAAIRGFDDAKLVQIRAANEAAATAAKAEAQAEKMKAEAASQKLWASECKEKNATGTTAPEVDCAKIKRKPAPVEQKSYECLPPSFGSITTESGTTLDVAKVEATTYLNWQSNARGEAQAPVYPTRTLPAARAQQVLDKYSFDSRYGLTPGYGLELFEKVGERHGVNVYMLICVAKADTLLGTATKSSFNIGNVGNNDRGNVVHFKDIGAGIDAIGRVLNNKYLSHKQSIGSLTPFGGGSAPFYATSPTGNWYNNVRNCLAEIYDDATIGPDWKFRS